VNRYEKRATKCLENVFGLVSTQLDPRGTLVHNCTPFFVLVRFLVLCQLIHGAALYTKLELYKTKSIIAASGCDSPCFDALDISKLEVYLQTVNGGGDPETDCLEELSIKTDLVYICLV
jgi:hypothetical protein